jgi:hypothetical protein
MSQYITDHMATMKLKKAPFEAQRELDISEKLVAGLQCWREY